MSFLNVSMICGIIVGSLLSVLVLGLVLLLRRGKYRVNLVSNIVTAVLASFLSLHVSFFIAEWKLNDMIEKPLDYTETGLSVVSKGISIINYGIGIVNLFGSDIPKIPETDPKRIEKLKADLKGHQNGHLVYMGVGILIAGTLLFFTMERAERSKSNSRRRESDSFHSDFSNDLRF